MQETETRISEFLEEKVKGDHEQQGQKDSPDGPSQDYVAVATPGDSHGIVPPGDITQGKLPKDKRSSDQADEEPEEKQRETSEPGAMTQQWAIFASSPVVDHASNREASSLSQGPTTAADIVA